MYKFNLVYGDIWHNGHGLYESTLMETNVNPSELEKLYRETTKKVGMSIDYIGQDGCQIPLEDIGELGLNMDDWKDEVGKDGSIWFHTDTYERLFIEFITTHNPHVIIQYGKRDETPIFELEGGYDFFH